MLRRLPLFLLLAVGAWLWKSDRLPQQRELVWLLDGERAGIKRVEIQLYGAPGTLLKREEFFVQTPSAPPQLVQHISLAGGDYTARVFIDRPPGSPAPVTLPVHLADEATLGLTVPIR